MKLIRKWHNSALESRTSLTLCGPWLQTYWSLTEVARGAVRRFESKFDESSRTIFRIKTVIYQALQRKEGFNNFCNIWRDYSSSSCLAKLTQTELHSCCQTWTDYYANGGKCRRTINSGINIMIMKSIIIHQQSSSKQCKNNYLQRQVRQRMASQHQKLEHIVDAPGAIAHTQIWRVQS